MKTKLLCSTAILAICLVSVPSTAQEAPVKLKLQPPPLADLLEAKAESVVSLKLVLKVQQTMMGQSRDTERTSEIRGVLINDQGLVLTASDAFEGGIPAALRRMLGDRIEMKATPTDIQVMFGNEVEEYEAGEEDDTSEDPDR